MGNSNSSEGSGGVPVGYFGVRITGDAMKDVLAGEEKHITENMNRKIQKAVENQKTCLASLGFLHDLILFSL